MIRQTRGCTGSKVFQDTFHLQRFVQLSHSHSQLKHKLRNEIPSLWYFLFTDFYVKLLMIPIGQRRCLHWESVHSRDHKPRPDKQSTGEKCWFEMLQHQDLTWTVLSNHRLPPLNLLPPPVNICLNISFMLLGTDRTVLFFRASNAGQHCLYVYECNNYFQSASFICIYLNPKPGLIRNILRFLIQTNQKEGGSNALQALNVDLPWRKIWYRVRVEWKLVIICILTVLSSQSSS